MIAGRSGLGRDAQDALQTRPSPVYKKERDQRKERERWKRAVLPRDENARSAFDLKITEEFRSEDILQWLTASASMHKARGVQWLCSPWVLLDVAVNVFLNPS